MTIKTIVLKILVLMTLVVGSMSLGPLKAAPSLNQMLKSLEVLNANTNVSDPTFVQDQQGGYTSLGGGSTRFQVQTVRPITVSPPSLKAGCNGIDFYAGGFSYISKEDFTNMMKNIGTAAASYGFQIAVQTACPQCANAMEYLQEVAGDMNRFSINSCEAAANMLGGVLPKNDATQRVLCPQIGQGEGKVNDYVSGRLKCGNQDQSDETMKEAQKKENFKDIPLTDMNLAWHAMSKSEFKNLEGPIKNFLMNLTGTVIVQNQQTQYIPSIIDDEAKLDKILNDEAVDMWQCDSYTHCLTVKKVKTTPKGLDDYKKKIIAQLNSIQDKLISGKQELSPEEHSFLNTSSDLPIMRMMDINLAYRQGRKPPQFEGTHQLVLYHILLKYLENVLSYLRDDVTRMKAVQIDDKSSFEKLEKDITKTQAIVSTKVINVYQQIDSKMKLLDRTDQRQKQLLMDNANTQ